MVGFSSVSLTFDICNEAISVLCVYADRFFLEAANLSQNLGLAKDYLINQTEEIKEDELDWGEEEQ